MDGQDIQDREKESYVSCPSMFPSLGWSAPIKPPFAFAALAPMRSFLAISSRTPRCSNRCVPTPGPPKPKSQSARLTTLTGCSGSRQAAWRTPSPSSRILRCSCGRFRPGVSGSSWSSQVLLVVINQVNVYRLAVLEAKDNAPVTGYANTPLPVSSALQRVQPVARQVHVLSRLRRIQFRQDATDTTNKRLRHRSGIVLFG